MADVVDRLLAAVNAHDAQAMAACFTDDYESEQPSHPGREFRGATQVAENWSTFFEEVPDLRMDLVNRSDGANVIWLEVHVHGHRENGSNFDMRGVMINTISNDRIARARIFFEPVTTDEGIRQSVQHLAKGER